MRKDDRLIPWLETEHVDLNDNGLDDALEPPEVDITASALELRLRLQRNTNATPLLSAGDVDAQWEMAESVGDETACGSCSTPDQNNVEAIGEAIGLIYREDEELKLVDKERMRDVHRWELDPASSDDYLERTRSLRLPRGRKSPFLH